jgi:hypothetical protein
MGLQTETGMLRTIGKTSALKIFARLAVCLLIVSQAGCYDDEEKATDTSGGTDGGTTGGGTSAPPPPSSGTNNRAPTVSGNPVTTAKISLPYSYQPTARDPDGDRLTFSITGKPEWATFSTSTGRLQGTPTAGSEGTFTGIQITVSDGKTTASTASFSISVVAPVVGSAELAWQAPTANEDGTALQDLAGYVIRYGRSYGALDQSVRIDNVGVTMHVVDNLVEGTWYFSLSSVNAAGVESRPTGYVSKTIS